MKTICLNPLRAATMGFLALCICASTVPAADMNPPDKMTYQSYVVDNSGNALGVPVPKNYDIQFRIWSDQASTDSPHLLWGEQQTVTVDKGYFSILLGEGNAIANAPRPSLSTIFYAADASDRYIEMTVLGIGLNGSAVTLMPRLRLMTAPYAFLSRHAISASGLVNNSSSPVVTVSGNNLGINKANPATALDVNGLITAQGMVANSGHFQVYLNNAGGRFSVMNAPAPGGTEVFSVSGSGAVAASSVTATGTVTANAFVGNGTIPVGGIILWSGQIANIPAGWALCDGLQGRPNLKDRFVIGAGGSYGVNAAAGSTNKHLVPANIPSHTHGYTFSYFQEHANDWRSGGGSSPGNGTGSRVDTASTTAATGSGTDFDIMPPYFALAYIIRVQ